MERRGGGGSQDGRCSHGGMVTWVRSWVRHAGVVSVGRGRLRICQSSASETGTGFAGFTGWDTAAAIVTFSVVTTPEGIGVSGGGAGGGGTGLGGGTFAGRSLFPEDGYFSV